MSHAARRFWLVVVSLFAFSSVFALAMPATALAWDASTYSSASESQLVSLTNQARANAGLKALKLDSTLRTVARWRSKDMIDRDYFSHTIPGVGMVWDKLDSIGYCYNVAGENIGWNTYPDDSATAAIQQAFMDSPGHRSNILGTAWDVIGVGAYKGPDGKKMWTVLFADKCGSVSTSTPKPKPHATAKPKPTTVTRVVAPRATPKPTPRPAAVATPTPSPTPTPAPLDTSPTLVPIGPPDDLPTPTPTATDTPPPGGDATPVQLRVVDGGPPGGLLETIVGTVTGSFFGG